MWEFTVENVVELNNLAFWAEENGYQNFAIRWQEEAHMHVCATSLQSTAQHGTDASVQIVQSLG